MSVNLYIEALLFASDKPLTIKELKVCLDRTEEYGVDKKLISKAIEEIIHKYDNDQYAFQIKNIGGGYTFMTKAVYHDAVSEMLKISSQKKLTTSALETLSIIAYKQPVTKSEMESIRGVNCDYTVQKLLDKELVEIVGRKEGPGKPLLYGTSQKFMNYFGLKSIDDLPKLKDFEQVDNTIGEQESIESNGENTDQ